MPTAGLLLLTYMPHQINTVGPLVLFQSTWPLLHASTLCPKFILISSVGGSISVGTEHNKFPAYGASKAAANYLTRKLHFEHEDLSESLIAPLHSLTTSFVTHFTHEVALAIGPGGVDTGMGKLFSHRTHGH